MLGVWGTCLVALPRWSMPTNGRRQTIGRSARSARFTGRGTLFPGALAARRSRHDLVCPWRSAWHSDRAPVSKGFIPPRGLAGLSRRRPQTADHRVRARKLISAIRPCSSVTCQEGPHEGRSCPGLVTGVRLGGRRTRSGGSLPSGSEPGLGAVGRAPGGIPDPNGLVRR